MSEGDVGEAVNLHVLGPAELRLEAWPMDR